MRGHNGPMDVRIARTRRRLQGALFELAQERGIDQVSVSDIAERAGVNRTTFYQHYSDRETLLADALDLITEEADVVLDDIDTDSPQPPVVLVSFLHHIALHGDLYQQVFTEPGYGVVLARLRQHVHDWVEKAAGAPGVSTDIPLNVVAAGLAGSIIGVMGEWLQGYPRASVEEAAGWVWKLVVQRPGTSAGEQD